MFNIHKSEELFYKWLAIKKGKLVSFVPIALHWCTATGHNLPSDAPAAAGPWEGPTTDDPLPLSDLRVLTSASYLPNPIVFQPLYTARLKPAVNNSTATEHFR